MNDKQPLLTPVLGDTADNPHFETGIEAGSWQETAAFLPYDADEIDDMLAGHQADKAADEAKKAPKAPPHKAQPPDKRPTCGIIGRYGGREYCKASGKVLHEGDVCISACSYVPLEVEDDPD